MFVGKEYIEDCISYDYGQLNSPVNDCKNYGEWIRENWEYLDLDINGRSKSALNNINEGHRWVGNDFSRYEKSDIKSTCKILDFLGRSDLKEDLINNISEYNKRRG